MLRHRFVPFFAVALLAALVASPAAAFEDGPTTTAVASGGIPDAGPWQWPVARFRVVRVYVQPVGHYSPGHRGVDLQPIGGGLVRAPAAGVVAFAGTVADRPLVTIDHGHGLVTTLEPVTASVQIGQGVVGGEALGESASGGHTLRGAVHFGVRYEGEYINPLLLLGGVPRAVLLPCCD